eukprot:363725-Chlamydomonas_euryale.AAC.11
MDCHRSSMSVRIGAGRAGCIQVVFAVEQARDPHQSCRRTVRSSRYIVLERKSIPIVACATPIKERSIIDCSVPVRRGSRLQIAAPYRDTRTWYTLSNLSYMKRVMMDVLPTDWSPRKTCAGDVRP